MKFLPKYMSLRIKMLIVIVARITIVFVTIYLWMYHFFTQSSTQALNDNVQAILHSGSQALNGDHLAGLLSAPSIDTHDPRYQKINEWFIQARAFDVGANPYIYYLSPNGKLVVLADSYALDLPRDSLAFAPGTQLDAAPDSILWTGLKQPTTDLDIHDTRQGTAVSGAEPIMDSNGKVVAGLAVDAAPGPMAGGQLDARDHLLPLLGLVYLLLSGSVWFITGNLTRTLRELDVASKRVGEGDYSPVDVQPGIFEDEITRLTATLNQMIEKVRGREEQLRKQVASLTIQVDQAKRRQSVDEVVSSDFFRDLKSKAKTMRDDHADEGKAE
jgi:HAMP domain-containing protein